MYSVADKPPAARFGDGGKRTKHPEARGRHQGTPHAQVDRRAAPSSDCDKQHRPPGRAGSSELIELVPR
jgi:hypothetical protein